VSRTIRPRAADRPLNPTEPPVANPEKWTVRGEHADCPLGTRGLSARHMWTVRNLVQRKLTATMDRKRRRARTQRTHDENCARGPSARPSRTVRDARTELKTARPPKSTLPFHRGQEFGDMKSVNQGCYTPKLSPPNFLNHRESWIL
jgi:hypothetical protein